MTRIILLSSVASVLVCSYGVSGQSAAQLTWREFFPNGKLTNWKRIPLAKDKKLSPKNPWKLDVKNKTLICDGVGIWEMLLFKTPVKDGVFHVEWRFKKVKDKKLGYNGGVYVRTSADGKEWLQAQVAVLDKQPKVADLFGDLSIDGTITRVVTPGTGYKHVNPIGEWNSYDIVCKGRSIAVKLNGKTVTRYKNCPRLAGHIGLQSEFYFLEFRNLKWTPRK